MDMNLQTGALDSDIVKNVSITVGKTPAQVLLKWNLQRGVSIIPKSSRIERVIENFNLFNFELDNAQVYKFCS